MRGLRVALVEQDDFASGTSSRSSRLIHGGVRYLEHGQIHLVFESSRERRTLQHIAPHLVRPLAFTWPVYRGARVPRWKLGIGLALYDLLALFRNVGRHKRLDARGVLANEPRVRTTGLTGGAQYWDAATDDVRLTLANVLSARDAGAVVLNHARVDAIRRDGERVTGARVVDVAGRATIEVRARVTVNATGAWSDRVEALAHAGAVAAVRGSKGVHVSVARSRVGNVSALTLAAPQDGRVMFVLPAGAFTIVGTTDTFDDVAPEDVRATVSDVDYLLAAANHYFPDAQLERSDVVSAWAGLRPLAAAGAASARDAGSTSREHAIHTTAPGLIRVTGGKLTTYRAMAEEIVDAVFEHLGMRASTSTTAHVALHGGDVSSLATALAEATRVTGDAVLAERLVHAHGSAWRRVWAMIEEDSSLGARIAPDRPYVLAELRYAVVHEMACTLGDLLIRRVPVAFETTDHGRAAARAVVGLVGTWLNWDEDTQRRAVSDFDAESARIFTVEA
jgi:glycerol-3-phosphate dehydrogenase